MEINKLNYYWKYSSEDGGRATGAFYTSDVLCVWTTLGKRSFTKFVRLVRPV